MILSSLLAVAAVGSDFFGVRSAHDHSSSTRRETIWFESPAKAFTESCLVGNGRLGGMLFGGVSSDRIALNEITLWSGGVHDQNRKDAYKALPAIEAALMRGDNPAAEALVNKTFTCDGPGSGFGNGKEGPYGCYQTLGDLQLQFFGPTGKPLPESVEGYKRSLDLNDAIATVGYSCGGVIYKRELIASAPAGALVYRVTANIPSSFDIAFHRAEHAEYFSCGSTLAMHGTLPNGTGGDGLKYVCLSRVRCVDGGHVQAEGNHLHVSGATEALVYVTAGTNYKGPVAGKWDGDDFEAKCKTRLDAVSTHLWDGLLHDHEKDYHALYGRVKLNLESTKNSALPTPKRMIAFAKGAEDPALAALYFQYGRYLLICSSRPGSLPANLQGLWAEEYATPWNGDYHLNINLQMNYWLAETCGLAPCAEPLVEFIRSLVKPGEETAKQYYNAPGWVTHVISNVWGYTAPGESASWGATNNCSGWLCDHLFQHWEFNPDRKYLESIYPVLKGSALFYLHSLVKEPKHGWLVTQISSSPENAFELPDGRQASVCMGPTMDMQILRRLFSQTARAARTLGIDKEFAAELDLTATKLAPDQIGREGYLQEWLEDYKETDVHHRHISQLYGLFPSDEITPEGTPELAQAAHTTLERRGAASTGWSTAWRINWYARLHDPDLAYRSLKLLLKPAFAADGLPAPGLGGSYPNLLDAHPPFQIDGNFGAASGIAEMLVQSQPLRAGEDPVIRLLPAMPKEWASGSVFGLHARGGYEVAVEWRHNKIITASIKALSSDGEVRLLPGEHVVITIRNKPIHVKKAADGVIIFALKRGETAKLRPAQEI